MRAVVVLLLVAACSGGGSSGPSNHGGVDPPKPKPVLTSPGALAKVHEALDAAGKCDACHLAAPTAGAPQLANAKCLDCHDHQRLRDRIVAGRGFHATAMVKSKECKVCHVDHRGRGYELTGWGSIKGGMKGFDHDLTGWKLDGKHASTDCDQCHKARDRQGLRLFMGTDRRCATCHGDDQPHQLPLATAISACERCHTESVWKPVRTSLRFDHNDRKDAAFPLAKAHENVACVKCHPATVFKLPAGGARCETCHGAKSPHGVHLFNQRPCDSCHSARETTWKVISFDHDEQAPLGKHRTLLAQKKLDCYSCHPKAGTKTTQPCEACHAAKSKHGVRFQKFGNPPACGTCHPITSWRPTRFDHAQTGFRLTYKHASVGCRDCHRGNNPATFEQLGAAQSTCLGCHVHKDVHQRKYKNDECLNCHMAPGNQSISGPNETGQALHGPRGTFPLVAGHRDVACIDCHKARNAAGKVTFDGLSRACETCHTDVHKGQKGTTCITCHTTTSWQAIPQKP